MNDQSILELYWNRNESAIRETSKRYGTYCFSIAHNILKNREDSDECVNDTWLHAWNAIPPARPGRLASYLGRITRNLSINRYKLAHAKKRGGGVVTVALEELMECIPDGQEPCGMLELEELDVYKRQSLNRAVPGNRICTGSAGKWKSIWPNSCLNIRTWSRGRSRTRDIGASAICDPRAEMYGTVTERNSVLCVH